MRAPVLRHSRSSGWRVEYYYNSPADVVFCFCSPIVWTCFMSSDDRSCLREGYLTITSGRSIESASGEGQPVSSFTTISHLSNGWTGGWSMWD